MSGKQRASALSPPEFLLLVQWGHRLYQAFDEMPYLVGSCERGGTYRDVDVRIGLSEKRFARFCDKGLELPVTLNMALSLWGRQVTGLPIDFQFQGQTEFHEYDGQTRNPIGLDPQLRYAPSPVPLPVPEEETQPTKCAACFGKGLTNQDARPGITLPAEDCRACNGSGASPVPTLERQQNDDDELLHTLRDVGP